MRFIILLAAVLLTVVGCKKENELTERPLAEAYGDYLVPSDVSSLINNDLPEEDSVAFVHAYIDEWIEEKVIQEVAEKNVPESESIEERVEEYRVSLVKHQYEQAMINERLDSIVSFEELSANYEERKEEFLLDKAIFQVQYVVAKNNIPGIVQFKRDWYKDGEEAEEGILYFCNNFAERFVFDEGWFSAYQINQMMPELEYEANDLFEGKEVKQMDSLYTYFLRISTRIKQGEVAPFDYVQSEIQQIILHQRKAAILDDLTKSLVKQELGKKNVIIHD